MDMFPSLSFCVTLAISESSWVTCTHHSHRAHLPALVHTAFASAPDAPGMSSEIFSQVNPLGSGSFFKNGSLKCPAELPHGEGWGEGNAIFLLMHPGRSRAESRISLLAAMKTLIFSVASNPSSWSGSSSAACCTALSPPEPPSCCEEQTESLLFMTMIDGVCSHAVTNSSLAILAPSLMKFCTIQSQMMNKGTTATPTVSSQCLRSTLRHSLGLRDAQGFKDA